MPNTMLIDVKGLGLVKPTLTTTAYLLLLICATLSGYSVTRLLVGFPLKKGPSSILFRPVVHFPFQSTGAEWDRRQLRRRYDARKPVSL